MAYFKNLITDKILKNKNAIQAQRLASCMAWQMLYDYPTRQKPSAWRIYNNLRGVMLADEVGGGKTFETLAIISKAILEQTSKTHYKDRFRVLIIANPSIRSKWEWYENENLTFEEFNSESYSPMCDIGKFIKQTKIDRPSTRKLFYFFSNQSSVSKKKNWIELDKYRQGIWLTSFTSIPKTKGSGAESEFINNVFPKDFFDWIIVDEAHSLKGSLNDMEECLKWNRTAVSKIYAVINGNKKAKLLLLTATPFQNNKYELQQLLNMLEVTDRRNNSKNITSLISIGINALEKKLSGLNGENISIESLKELKINIENDINALIGNEVEEELQRPTMVNVFGNKAPCKNGLDDYLRDIMIRNTKESLLIKPVIAHLNKTEKFQYLLYRDLIKTSEDESQMFSTKLSQLVSSRNSFSKSNINSIQNSHIEKLFKGNLVFEAKYKKPKM